MSHNHLLTHNSIGFILTSIQNEDVDGSLLAMQSSDSDILLIVTDGYGSIKLQADTYLLRKGSSFLIKPYTSFEVHGDTDHALSFYLLSFISIQARLLFENIPIVALPAGVVEGLPFSRAVMLVQELYEHRGTMEVARQMLNHMRFQELMLLVWNQLQLVEQNSRKMVEQVAAFIQNHFYKAMDMEQLIQSSGLSKRYFNQLFREVTGTSVNAYLTDLRMTRAKQLLEQSDDSIQDIARTVGYEDEFYFNRRFKQWTGMAPRQYARSRTIGNNCFATQYLGHLLALGIKPVGATSNMMGSTFLHELTAGIPSIAQPVKAGEVSALNPDLIIGWEASDHELLSDIAPVVLLPYGEHHAMEQLNQLADLLNRRVEAKQWMNRYEKKAMQLRSNLSSSMKHQETVSIFEVWEEGIVVYGNRWGRGGYNLYNALELNAPAKVREHLIDGEPYRFIPIEELPSYAGDHIFLSVYDTQGGGRRRAADLKHTSIWSSLPAVERNRVYDVDIRLFGAGDPISLSRQLDIQVNLLLSGNGR
ncbi:helix-turn-helix domain-containing protein [Paenibacillus sp. 2TAB23]|uniref:AraC family transcriptional regulator n=1 Tax=Paenibacillus sp. 2TAB23 TaxID=3233004 RepID=UPI003F94CCCD